MANFPRWTRTRVFVSLSFFLFLVSHRMFISSLEIRGHTSVTSLLLSTRNTWLRERLTTLTINSQGSPKHLDRDGISIINVGGSGTSFLYITWRWTVFNNRVISTSFYPSSLEKHWNMYRKTVPWNSRVFNETKGATA